MRISSLEHSGGDFDGLTSGLDPDLSNIRTEAKDLAIMNNHTELLQRGELPASTSRLLTGFNNQHTKAIDAAMSRHADLQRQDAISDHQERHVHCATAAEADRKVEILGNEVVNPLEKRVADLEDLNLEQRVDTLYQRLRPYEDYKTLVDDQVTRLRQTEQALRTKRDELELPLKTEVEKQAADLDVVTQKVQQLQDLLDQQSGGNKEGQEKLAFATLTSRVEDLENQSLSSSADANSLALDLLDRLQNGDLVHPALARQIKLALPKGRQSDSSEDQTRNSAPPKGRKKDVQQVIGGVSKRRGRPLKHGRYSQKATTDEIRKLLNDSERKASATSSNSLSSLSRTPSADVSSAQRSTSALGNPSKTPTNKMEVPETQQKDDDVEMEDDGAYSEGSEEPPFIPGERKSGRAPKPRHFADQVGWKEANKTLRGLKPGSP